MIANDVNVDILIDVTSVKKKIMDLIEPKKLVKKKRITIIHVIKRII